MSRIREAGQWPPRPHRSRWTCWSTSRCPRDRTAAGVPERYSVRVTRAGVGLPPAPAADWCTVAPSLEGNPSSASPGPARVKPVQHPRRGGHRGAGAACPYNETGRRCPRGDTAAALRSLAADPRLAVLLQRAEPRVLDIAELCRTVLRRCRPVGSLRRGPGVATRDRTRLIRDLGVRASVAVPAGPLAHLLCSGCWGGRPRARGFGR